VLVVGLMGGIEGKDTFGNVPNEYGIYPNQIPFA
jgi:hypothetical protein